jgi:hypothetical protein
MADRMPPAWAERLLDNLLGPIGQDGPLTCRLVTAPPKPVSPAAEELRILAADLLELHEANALAGIRAVVSERLRQVRGEPAQGIDGRAYQAAMLAGEIDREA